MQLKYSQESLEEMADQVDLLEYASQSHDFTKRSGNTYYCLCPFHNEKTPSLAINTDENYFYCFSCGKAGNIYKWLQYTEGLTFNQAVEKVAAITNSDLHGYVESESMAFYKLLNRINNPSKKLVVPRMKLDIIKDYQQRFVDELPQEWVDEGISPEELRKYEVRIDPTSNRIVYPVRDADFNLVGVKGRTRFRDFKMLGIMKYMNYHRIGVLDFFTGAMQASPYVKKSGEIIIFEGIKSVMKVDQWGYHNAVSAETSVLNNYQIELLVRLQVKNVVIAFDKDVGLKKIRECTELLRKFTNVWVVYDNRKLLGEKDSPPDRGREVWEILYDGRIRL